MTPDFRKKGKKSRAQHWMFLASSTTFILATVQEAALLANIGIFVHLVLVGYQESPLMDKFPLVNELSIKTELILVWVGCFGVRVLINLLDLVFT